MPAGTETSSLDPAKRDIATEAYQNSLKYLKTEFDGNPKALEWLSTAASTTLLDVLVTTQEAEARYTQMTQKKQGIKSWLRGLSKRIMFFSQVLDTLAQQHPEYLSLVWGVVKFVLMV